MPAQHPAGWAAPTGSGVEGCQAGCQSAAEGMPLRIRLCRAAWLSCAALVLIHAPAAAQPVTTLEFSFSNPGARSMGFGGAFVALADDATAAFANPAGLVQLVRPELSIEARSWSYDTPFTRGGRAAGPPTGLGIDVAPGPLVGVSSPELSGLSFASFAYPGRRWAFALYQHQLANYEFSLETQGVFGSTGGQTGRTTIQTGFWDLEIVTRGLAAAWRLGERLSLGIGVSHFDPAGTILGRDYLPDDDSIESFFAAASFLPARLTQVVSGQIEEPDWGWTAGLLWSPAPGWKLGGAFRQGPELVLELDLVTGPGDPRYPPGTVLIRDFPLDFHLPDVLAVGVSYRSPDGRWAGAVEWNRVDYSVIMESLGPQVNEVGEFIDDADEIHLGGEYTFLESRPLWAVRLGLWLDPDHRVRAAFGDAFDQALLPGGDDELHYAGGLGGVLGRFQIDLAFDLSALRDTAAFSVIYSF